MQKNGSTIFSVSNIQVYGFLIKTPVKDTCMVLSLLPRYINGREPYILLKDNRDEGFCMEFKPDCLSPAPDRGAQKELLWTETICPIFPIRDQEDR